MESNSTDSKPVTRSLSDRLLATLAGQLLQHISGHFRHILFIDEAGVQGRHRRFGVLDEGNGVSQVAAFFERTQLVTRDQVTLRAVAGGADL